MFTFLHLFQGVSSYFSTFFDFRVFVSVAQTYLSNLFQWYFTVIAALTRSIIFYFKFSWFNLGYQSGPIWRVTLIGYFFLFFREKIYLTENFWMGVFRLTCLQTIINIIESNMSKEQTKNDSLLYGIHNSDISKCDRAQQKGVKCPNNI